MNNLNICVASLVALMAMNADTLYAQDGRIAFDNHKLEVGDVRTSIVEVSAVYSVEDNKHANFIVFLVEDLKDEKRMFASSTIQFKGKDKKVIPINVSTQKGPISSQSKTSNFNRYDWRAGTKKPTPSAPEKTHVFEYWFDSTAPSNAKFLTINFYDQSFDFPLRK